MEKLCSGSWKVIYNQTPDLIFIDGRFRVACALYSIIMMRDYPKTKILIDDYLNVLNIK